MATRSTASSPWYILRNQLAGFMEAPFKFRTTDRSVIAHNTIVMWGKMICCSDAHLLRSIVRNNLWLTASGGQIWDFGSTAKDWRSDFDNDGFDWGSSTAPFRYGGVVYSSVAAFAAASGLETHGRQRFVGAAPDLGAYEFASLCRPTDRSRHQGRRRVCESPADRS